MARQIVEDHDVTCAQHGNEDLLDIGEEALRVDRPIEHKLRYQPIAGQADKERRRLPMSVRRMDEGTCADIGPYAYDEGHLIDACASDGEVYDGVG